MLSLIKQLLKIKDDSQDALILYYIDSVTRQIFAYCNISLLPKVLEHIVIEKVLELMRNQEDQSEDQSVKAISRGDTKIEYAVSGNKTAFGEDILKSMRSQLAPFRKIRSPKKENTEEKEIDYPLPQESEPEEGTPEKEVPNKITPIERCTEIEAFLGTYKDQVTVYRQELVENANFETIETLVPVYHNLPCALSKNSKTSNVIGGDVTTVKEALTLFITPTVTIRANDLLEVIHESGEMRKYKAGEGFYYVSHLEIPVIRQEWVKHEPSRV